MALTWEKISDYSFPPNGYIESGEDENFSFIFLRISEIEFGKLKFHFDDDRMTA